MPQKDKATTSSQEQQEPWKMAVETMASHFNESVKFCFCTRDVQELLLTYSVAFTLPRGDQLSLYLALSFDSLDYVSGTADVSDLLTINQDSDFDAQLVNI